MKKIGIFVLGFVFMFVFSGFVVAGDYIIEENFGAIIYENLEAGLNADTIDYLSTLFDNPVNGEFARYNIPSNIYDSDMGISIVEFEDTITFEMFEDKIVSIFVSQGMDLDYDPTLYIEDGGLENAQILFTGNYDVNVASPGNAIWISNNVLVYISFDDWRVLEENEDPTMDDHYENMLEYYLETFPSTLVPVESGECIDSDGGLNVLVDGEAYVENEGGQGDYCYSNNQVMEAYCIENPEYPYDPYTTELMLCPSSAPYCVAGACVAEQGFCEETDDGMDPLNLGTTYPKHIADHPGNTDYCQSLSTNQPRDGCVGTDCGLREFYCIEGTYSSSTKDVACPEGCSNGVCVGTTEIPVPPTPTEPDTMSVDIAKGWNLIYGFVEPDQITFGSTNGEYIEEGDIRAIYALMPNLQEYARAWPDAEWDKLGTLDDDEILNMGMWVYSDRSGPMTYRLYTEIMPFYKRQIYDGWNFVGITPEMVGNDRLEELVGDCSITRSYIFDENSQTWEKLSLDIAIDNNEAIGKTWVIKVENDCRLGEVAVVIPAPPVLPEEDDTSVDTDEPLEIGGYVLTNTHSGEDCDEVNEGGVSGTVCMTISELRYENSNTGDAVRMTLIDYTKGVELVREYFSQYLVESSLGLDYVYETIDGGTILWFADGKYDLIAIEGYNVGENAVVDYFYNKYPGVGIELASCIDSDEGHSYFRQGTTYGLNSYNGAQTDFCFNYADLGVIPYEELRRPEGTGIIEHYCDQADNVANEGFECPNGCEYGACVRDGECVMEGVSKKDCSFKGVVYTVRKLDGCGIEPTNLEVSYEGIVENVAVDQGSAVVLENGVSLELRGAPCGYDITNIQFTNVA